VHDSPAKVVIATRRSGWLRWLSREVEIAMFTVLFLDGRAPAEREFVQLAAQIELFDRVEGASEGLRQLVAQRCPHLLHKLEPVRMLIARAA